MKRMDDAQEQVFGRADHRDGAGARGGDAETNNHWSTPAGLLNTGSTIPNTSLTSRNVDLAPDTGAIDGLNSISRDEFGNIYFVGGGKSSSWKPQPERMVHMPAPLSQRLTSQANAGRSISGNLAEPSLTIFSRSFQSYCEFTSSPSSPSCRKVVQRSPAIVPC